MDEIEMTAKDAREALRELSSLLSEHHDLLPEKLQCFSAEYIAKIDSAGDICDHIRILLGGGIMPEFIMLVAGIFILFEALRLIDKYGGR